MVRIISMFRLLLLFIAIIIGCDAHRDTEVIEDDPALINVKILQAWQGDYPVNQLPLFPADQQDQAIGYISDEITYSNMWKHFKPDQDIPDIDFKNNLVLFARNMQFYNRISIGQVKLKNGVVEVVTMETMSALPIEQNLALSLAVVPRQGIISIHIGDRRIKVQ